MGDGLLFESPCFPLSLSLCLLLGPVALSMRSKPTLPYTQHLRDRVNSRDKLCRSERV
jgi:hypothetical protein